MKLLIAENEFHTADQLLRLAETLGCAADWVRSGTELRRQIHAGRYGLILLSTDLPDITLETFLPELHEAYPGLPVVALSARSSLPLERAVRELGVAYYIVKPPDISEIWDVICHLNEKRINQPWETLHEKTNPWI